MHLLLININFEKSKYKKTISFNFSLLHVSLSKLHSNVPESLFNSSIHFISVFFFKIPNILPHLQFFFSMSKFDEFDDEVMNVKRKMKVGKMKEE